MESLKFDEGYKEYSINNDENRIIRYNTTDMGVVDRINKAQIEIEKIVEEMKEKNISAESTAEEIASAMEIANTGVRKQIDYIFNSKISDIAFEEQNCMSPVKGIPLYERFLESIIPTIQVDIDKENALTQKRIKKYTDITKKR
ncbi:MAG: hypothetical protein RR436_07080 [Clostridia bacterium]